MNDVAELPKRWWAHGLVHGAFAGLFRVGKLNSQVGAPVGPHMLE